MRMFDLFLRRAGVDAATSLNLRRAVSRLTVECAREHLPSLRKQICLDFQAAGLDVAHMQVHAGAAPELARACITVTCPPERRPVLMDQARLLNANPEVRGVRFGHRPVAQAA